MGSDSLGRGGQLPAGGGADQSSNQPPPPPPTGLVRFPTSPLHRFERGVIPNAVSIPSPAPSTVPSHTQTGLRKMMTIIMLQNDAISKSENSQGLEGGLNQAPPPLSIPPPLRPSSGQGFRRRGRRGGTARGADVDPPSKAGIHGLRWGSGRSKRKFSVEIRSDSNPVGYKKSGNYELN